MNIHKLVLGYFWTNVIKLNKSGDESELVHQNTLYNDMHIVYRSKTNKNPQINHAIRSDAMFNSMFSFAI